MTDERKEFEAWCVSVGGEGCDFSRDEAGNYTGHKTAATWKTWRAARRSQADQVRELVEEARGGFTQAYMRAAEQGDMVLLACMKAHHSNVNRIIDLVGGETTELVDLESLAQLKDTPTQGAAR